MKQSFYQGQQINANSKLLKPKLCGIELL